MSNFDATARISVDLSAFSRAAQAAGRETGAWNTALQQLQNSVTRIEPIEKRRANNIQRTLNIYQRTAQAVSTYATAIDRLSQNSTRASSASQRFNNVITSLGRSLSNVRGIGESEFNRLNRTVTLYERLARAVSTYAGAIDRMATSTARATTAQERANQATARAATAAEALRTQQARTATAQSNAAAAAARAAAAQDRLNGVTRAGAVANIDYSTSIFSLRSALTDYQGLLRQVLDILSAIPSATFSAAIAQEQAFAQIARVTQDTTIDLQAMRTEFQTMATEIPLAFGELTNIAVLGSQIGIAREELLRFTDTVAKFSATNAVTSEQTALLAGRIAQLGEVPETEFVNLLSGISELGSNSAATEEAILRMTEQIATSTRSAGFSTEAMIGLAGAIASLGLRPELARGALQRVFAILRDNVDEAADSLEGMAQLMGLTAQEVQNLQATQPEQFFLKFVEGVGNAQERGEALRATLRGIGINNTRDIELISRLGLNYDFLAAQIDLANDSYAEANFLNIESERIFGTTQSTLTRLSNAWENFRANAIDPMLRVLAPAIAAVATGLNLITQSPIASFLAGTAVSIATAGAAWVAYRVALTGIAAGLIAMRQVQQQSNAVTISATGIWNLYRQTQTNATAATTANTIATTANTRATGINAATLNLAAANLGRTAMQAGTAATAMRAMTLSMGPMGIAMTAISVLMAGSFIAGLGSTRDRLQEAARSAIDAAGGMSAFQTAVRDDTRAMQEGERVHRTYTSSRVELTEKTREGLNAIIDENRERIRQIELLQGNTAELRQTAKGTGDAAEEAAKYVERIDEMGKAILEAQNQLDGTTAAFGENAAAMQRSAIETALFESSLVKSERAMEIFRETGIELGPIIEKSFTDPQGAIEELDNLIRKAAEGVYDLENANQGVQYATSEADLKAWEDIFTAVDTTKAVIGEYDGELQKITTTNQLMGNSMRDMSKDAMAAGDELNNMDEAAGELGETMAEVSEVAQELAKVITGFGGPLSAWEKAVADANESAREQYKKTNDSLDGFSEAASVGLGAYIEELEKVVEAQRDWSTNMVAVAARVPEDIAMQLAQLGPTAAPLIAELVDASDKEISQLIPLFRATSEEAALALGEGLEFSIPALGGIGRDAGSALAGTLSNELAAAAKSGGDFHEAINQYLALLMVLDEAEANPFVSLNDLEARKTLDDLEADIRRRERDARLDPKGFAQLNPDLYQYEMRSLELAADSVTERNLLGPIGEAELNDTDWRSKLEGLEGRSESTTKDNKLGPEGQPGLNPGRYIDQLAAIENRAKRTNLVITRALTMTPRLVTALYYNQLYAMEARARLSGARIQQSLTRTATVNVRTVQSGATGARAMKDGGWVTGPGGPRQDNIPIMGSSGEFMVNAAAAKQHGALLEAINNSDRGQAVDTGLITTLAPSTRHSGAPAVRVPERIQNARSEINAQPGLTVNVTNHYPRAEPTSTTVNRALVYAAALEGV